MNSQYERRNFATSIEVRSAGGKNTLIGRAASYNKLSKNLGGFKEIIAHGAFARAVREKDDALFTVNHDSNALPLGRVSSGTLRLSEDANGLVFQCDLPNTQAARDLAESIARNDISECSFAFSVAPDGSDEDWSQATDEDGVTYPLRKIRNFAALYDCSAVSVPAYGNGATNISATSMGALAAQNLSSLVAPRALQEARRLGGYAPRPRIVLAEPASRYAMHKRLEGMQQRWSKEEYDQKVADFVNGRPRPNSHVEEK